MLNIERFAKIKRIVDRFTITASKNMLNELFNIQQLYPNEQLLRNKYGVSFGIYYSEIKVVSNAISISKNFPDETIYVSFAAKEYHWCREEQYEVKNGEFIFTGLKWSSISIGVDNLGAVYDLCMNEDFYKFHSEPELLKIYNTRKEKTEYSIVVHLLPD